MQEYRETGRVCVELRVIEKRFDLFNVSGTGATRYGQGVGRGTSDEKRRVQFLVEMFPEKHESVGTRRPPIETNETQNEKLDRRRGK